MIPRLLTVREMAVVLKISLSLAYNLIARGEIPRYEIASCIRVAEEDLRQYLERQKQAPVRLPKHRKKHF